MSSYIYAIKCGEFYKIGATRNPEQRMETLDHYSPLEMDIKATYEVPDKVLFKIEKEVQRRLEDEGLRHKFEWFHRESWDGIDILPMVAGLVEEMKLLTSGVANSDSLQLWNIRSSMDYGMTKTKIWGWLISNDLKKAASYFRGIKEGDDFMWADVEYESGRKLAEYLGK